MSVPDNPHKPQDLEAFDFTMSVRYLFNSVEKLMCRLPPLTSPYGFLWYLGLPVQLLIIILGKLIRLPAEIWESAKDETVKCKKYNKLGFIGYILTFAMDTIMFVYGGVWALVGTVLGYFGVGYSAIKAKDLLIPQVKDFEFDLT